jgi:DNA-binding NarL/FixJ family response regulator
MNEVTRILIVDDHPVVRLGITQLISEEPDLQVIADAEGPQEAMKRLAEDSIEMTIVDLSLEGGSGLELVGEIKRQYPDMPVLVLSMHDESLYAERALRAGASGYVMKQAGTETLIKAIRRVLEDKIYLSDDMVNNFLSKASGRSKDEHRVAIENLSNRELEVFELLGKGNGTKQVAEALGLSVKTIETYRSNIKSKLGMSSSSQLLKEAAVWVNSLKE